MSQVLEIFVSIGILALFLLLIVVARELFLRRWLKPPDCGKEHDSISPFEEIGFVIKIPGCVELYSENTTIKVTRGAKVTLRPAILDEKGADVLNHVDDDITVSWEYTNTPLTENILECKLDITESDDHSIEHVIDTANSCYSETLVVCTVYCAQCQMEYTAACKIHYI